MPQMDPGDAVRTVLRFLPDIPAWPQLPRKSVKENMYVQYSEGFPGFSLDGERFHVSRAESADKALEALYAAHLENKSGEWKISPDYAAGLYALVETLKEEDRGKPRLALKGQMTGPISWGLTVTDQDKRPVLYDDTLCDAMAKHLRLKASWQEAFLARGTQFQIVTLDEPFMSAYGSAYVSLTKEKVIALLDEVFGGMTHALKGIHCCGNTDWSVLLATSVDIINPDVYNYANSFNLYPDEIRNFLGRDGFVAWGIVPTDETSLKKETVSSLRDRLEEVIAPLTRKGVPFRKLLERSLVTPCCGMASLSVEASELGLETLTGLSAELRKKSLGGARG